MAHAKGFAAGVLAGVLIGAGGVAYLGREAVGPAAVADADAGGDDAATSRPRFDFYTLLPNQNLDLAADVEPAELTNSRQADDLYMLQAGSFRLQKDADRRRGELALLGLEASIEKVESDNGLWFRVYIGPFETRSAMARARSMTAQQAIDTLLLKRPRTP